MARLNPCPSFINPTRNLLALRKAPINSSNLILFAHALSKAISNLHPPKTSSSANLDSFGVQPSLRDFFPGSSHAAGSSGPSQARLYSSLGYQSVPRPSGAKSNISQSGSRSGAPRGSCPGSAIVPLISPL